jgi:uncharacterized protein YbjT (DUF2867 family)
MTWKYEERVNMTAKENPGRVLVTGATGYIGARLLKRLEQQDLLLRCLARDPQRLAEQTADTTEVMQGDLLDFSSLAPSLRDIHTAFYLVHSMDTEGDFESEDHQAALNFARAAHQAGVQRIIYVGGLGDSSSSLSPHLRSRQDVGKALRTFGCQVIELRASIVIGSGSLSYELVRCLVQRLPVMICPKWVATYAQPIAIDDLLDYLQASLHWNSNQSQVFEIGGPDRATYGDIMKEYARQRGLRRWLISVPLVTPVYARIGRKLVESMRNPTIVTDSSAMDVFSVRPRGLVDAIAHAISSEDAGTIRNTNQSQTETTIRKETINNA